MKIRHVQGKQIEINRKAGPGGNIRKSANLPADSVEISGKNAPGESAIKINVLHLNDVHGAVEPMLDPDISKESPVGGLAYSSTIIEDQKAENPDGTLTLNAGDMAEGSMAAYMTRGKIVTEALNRMNFDAFVLGNHDFEWGQEELGTIVRDLNAPVVAANVVKTADGAVMDGVKPYIMKRIKGINIAIIGLDTTDTERYIGKEKLEGLRFENEIETARKYVPEVKEKGADIVMILSHLGFEADKELAKSVDGIDVIVGGHSHTALKKGYKSGNTIIVQAGSQSRYVGNLELEVDPGTKRIVGHRAELIPVITKETRPDNAVLDILTPYLQQVDQKGAEVMGEALTDLHYGHKIPLLLNQILTDAILKESGAEIGLCSSRILRGNLREGEVTYKELYGALPFTSEKFYTVKTTGRQVIKEIESRLVDGGRGVSVPAGFKYEYDPSLPEGSRVTSTALPDGTPLDPKKEYTVALNSSTIIREAFVNAKDKEEKGEVQKAFFRAFREGSPWNDYNDCRVAVLDNSKLVHGNIK